MNSEQAPLSETDLTEYLDNRDALDTARQPGCYALRLADPPDDDVAVIHDWFDHFEASPPGGLPKRFAEAERLVYVGSHAQSVYQRLCQHVAGHKSSTIMEIWPPVDVVAIWPSDAPTDREWGHANELADDRTACWVDGEYI